MKKIFSIVVVLVIIGFGAYFYFFAGRGGLKIEESTTTKSGNTTSVSKSSTSKTPVVGLAMERGSLKLNVTAVTDDEVTFGAPVKVTGTSACVPGTSSQTYTLKKGEKMSLSDCANADKTYNISF